MKQGLQLITQNQLVTLSKPQNGLLSLIIDAINNKNAITMHDIVDCYCKYIRCNYYDPWDAESKEYMIKEEFKKHSHVWTYRLRSLIKSWFVNTIGTLVLKGKLMVLPIIKIED